jgi:hypothetical protein
MEGPDADQWPTVTARTAWDWQSNAPCTEAAELAASGADEARILPVVARYTIENLILNAVHEVGEWLRVDGHRVFPPHPEPAATGGDQGNGSVTLQFTYGTDVSPSGAVGGPELATSPSQSRRLVGSLPLSFTYLPQTSISYDEVGPMVTRWSQPHAPWRSSWSPSSSRLGTSETVERGVHRMLVLHEADRICRAFHVDGRRPWRLATCAQDLRQAGTGDGSMSAEPLSITIVDAGS